MYQCDDYLAQNKQRIVKAAKDLLFNDEITRLVVAVAMQETNACCAKQRDQSKDGTPSQNYSCFNLNKDMLEQCGWHEGGPDLNDNENVWEGVAAIQAAVSGWGIDGFLNYHRGGRTAFQDGTSYGAADYRQAIHATMDYLAQHPEHLTDCWRVGFGVPHV